MRRHLPLPGNEIVPSRVAFGDGGVGREAVTRYPRQARGIHLHSDSRAQTERFAVAESSNDLYFVFEANSSKR
jgi:hypothetical protein